MMIDDRLARLAERVEALTHSLELVATMQVQNEKLIAQLASAQARTEQSLARLTDETAELERGMGRVVNILLIHEQRLDNLEGRGTQ